MDLTELSASALINDLNAMRPPSVNQLELLRRHGVSEKQLPDLYVDARAMLAVYDPPTKTSNTDLAIAQAIRKSSLAYHS